MQWLAVFVLCGLWTKGLISPLVPCHQGLSAQHLTTLQPASLAQMRESASKVEMTVSYSLLQKEHVITFAVSCSVEANHLRSNLYSMGGCYPGCEYQEGNMSEAATTLCDCGAGRRHRWGMRHVSPGQRSVLHLEGERNRTEGRGLGTQAIPGTLGLSIL